MLMVMTTFKALTQATRRSKRITNDQEIDNRDVDDNTYEDVYEQDQDGQYQRSTARQPESRWSEWEDHELYRQRIIINNNNNGRNGRFFFTWLATS